MSAEATEVAAHVTTVAETRTALTLMQAATVSLVESVMAAEAAAEDAMKADVTEVEKHVTTIAEARTTLTPVGAGSNSQSCRERNGRRGSSRQCTECSCNRSGGIRDNKSSGEHCTYTGAGNSSG